MRFFSTSFLLCFAMAVFAQEDNSLLWEISGNGLKQSSYLYGTMHVSKKIAFHLDDVFYEALYASEIVALESDPGTWLESDVDRSGANPGSGYGFDPKGFYSYSFIPKPPSKQELGRSISSEDRLVNNILYRTNEYAQNFEEDTYLDMFIYRAGAKYGKSIVALEDMEEATALVGRASRNAMKQKPDEWLQKKMQQQDLTFLMQNAYRERNINLLDSIDRAMYTDYYLQHMLYLRNENMAEKLNSVMQKGKVFAGIGAAHLPGKRGVIALLRQKGYQVKPLISEATAKGKSLKEKIESKTLELNLKRYAPEDNFFSVKLPSKLILISHENKAIYVAADLANGSYFMVNRIPTFSYLKENEVVSLDDINQLLFENIPGSIVSKNKIVRNELEGLDIRNKLKNGDHQRYQIFLTPLEIIIFKMSGEGEYVDIHSDKIFDSLVFEKTLAGNEIVSSAYTDFEIRMPAQHHFYNPSQIGDRYIEGYDKYTNSYFFLKKVTINDLNFIEEDRFELKQIQRRFYQDLDLNPIYDKAENGSLSSKALVEESTSEYLYLKSYLQNGDYYLLGAKTSKPQQAEEFLNSFVIKDNTYSLPFEKIRDTAMYFSTVSPVKPLHFVENSVAYMHGQRKSKPYNAYTKKTRYQNKNNEAVSIELNKAHDFMTFPDIDSLWTLRKKYYQKKQFKIIREKNTRKENDLYTQQYILVNTGSTRGILVKNVVKNGLLYEIKTRIDTLLGPSKFVREFYNNFSPLDTVVGKSLMEDKVDRFFTALRENDSIIRKGYRFPIFKEHHIDSLIYYISHHKFQSDQKHIEAHLIHKLGELSHPKAIRFFNEYYASAFNNSSAQTKVLQAVSNHKNEESLKLLLALLQKDLPLVSNHKEIGLIFEPYQDSLPLARKLFPELLDFSTITEYKLPIISLMADLKSNGLIKTPLYKKYRKQLLNDAKLQLKRSLGQNNENMGYQRSYQKLGRRQTNQLLEDYIILLYPFRKEKEVAHFFSRLTMIKEPTIRTTYAMVIAEHDEHSPLNLIDSLAGDINSRKLIFDKLKHIGKPYLFPDAYRIQEALSEAALFEDRRFLSDQDEIVYLGKETIEEKGKEFSGYFFKMKSEMDYDKGFKLFLVVHDPEEGMSSSYYYKNKGYRIPDTETDLQAMEYVKEGFLLRNRKRATVFKPESYKSYSFLGL